MIIGIAIGLVLSLATICILRWFAIPKALGAQKLDHIKYDILPDGTLGPGDNRNLEAIADDE